MSDYENEDTWAELSKEDIKAMNGEIKDDDPSESFNLTPQLNVGQVDQILASASKPMTIEDIIDDLTIVLERIEIERGDKTKTIYDLKEAFRCGYCDGSQETILYVLKKLKEMAREESGERE